MSSFKDAVLARGTPQQPGARRDVNESIPGIIVTLNEINGSAAAAAAAITDSSGGTAGSSPYTLLNNAITDSSGGTAGSAPYTIAAITQAANAGSADIAPTANAIAKLAAAATTSANSISKITATVNLLTSGLGNQLASKMWMLSGTNAVSSNVAISAGGGLTLTTTAAASDQMIVGPRTGTVNAAGVASGRYPSFECYVETGASITSTTIAAGLKLTATPVVATDDDQAFFRYEAGVASGYWQLVTSNAGTDTTTSTSATFPKSFVMPAVAASTFYGLRFEIQQNFAIKFWIQIGVLGDWNLVYQSPANAVRTGITLLPYVILQTATGAKSITLWGPALGNEVV